MSGGDDVAAKKRVSACLWFSLAAALGASACGCSGEGGPASQGASSSATGAGGAGDGGASGAGSSFALDECAEGTHDCAPDAKCIDTPSYYTCACKPGYEGDGKTCADIDECQTLLLDCDPNAVCTNEPGGYACACPPGFTGDSKNCRATYSAVSAGYYHACAIRSDKTLWCWGLNTSGQIGTGMGDTLFLRPAAAGDASDWAKVSAGLASSCALSEAKKIFCWGANEVGQLGDGTMAPKFTPTPIAGDFTDWIALDAGSKHVCAIREGGKLYCWGRNSQGQVGDGTTGNHSLPTPVSMQGPWLSVSAGADFTCAVRDDHALFCWGLNGQQQLGDGTADMKKLPVQEKTLATDWARVTAGNAFACGVKLDGSRWCWGANQFGQGGNKSLGPIKQPTNVDMATDWAAIEASDFATCGLKTDGSLWCWGDGSSGQTAQPGNETLSSSPAQVGGDTDWTSITGGLRFACGIHADGRLVCWGAASHSALGLGYSSDRSEPSLVGADADWERVDVQQDNGCAIRKGGDLFCWGRNVFGHLGDEMLVTRVEPVKIGAGKKWKRVALGPTHTCGIASDGGAPDSLWCWGMDGSGELGNGSLVVGQKKEPTAVSSTPGNDSPWTEIAAGFNHTCALRQDGTLWCWGSGGNGQLGDGATQTREEPKQVLPMAAADWTQVAISGNFTCALRASGALFCWGLNTNAQLGLGNSSLIPVTSPTQVGSALYVAVDAGQSHTCAVAKDGTLWCWGLNQNAALGLGNDPSAQVTSPTQVGSEKDWARPFLGQGYSSCALKQGGDLYCWGYGLSGQLGLGTLASSSTPQKVPAVGSWTTLALGNEHTCGVRTDGRLLCWGASYWAQLGGGQPIVSTPTLVLDPH